MLLLGFREALRLPEKLILFGIASSSTQRQLSPSAFPKAAVLLSTSFGHDS
jgi:predicted DNA-binding transcriptional regulator AlpA